MLDVLPPEATIRVLCHQLEEGIEGVHFRLGRIAVPLEVRAFPEHLPDIPALHVAGLRDRLLDLLRRIGKVGPH